MGAGPKRVLVVDDSAVMRRIISDALAGASGIEVVGRAGDGEQAVELCRRLSPDVVTLDLQMPGMDGLTTLRALLALRPVAVVMVSSLTQAGARITLDGLQAGAVDYLAKPEGRGLESFARELLAKIRAAAEIDVAHVLANRHCGPRPAIRPEVVEPAQRDDGEQEPLAAGADLCIAIGISTGGPPALSHLFAGLRPPLPPIVVVQHMPAQFTRPLAERLNGLAALSISEAEQGAPLRPNHVLIAPGGRHLEVNRQGKQVQATIADGDLVSGHKPSVDRLMTSVARAYGANTLAVIMTGMGRDGVEGCRAVRSAGGVVLGQDEASSDVYGMNKAAYAEGHVHLQFSLDDAATVITTIVRRWSEPSQRRLMIGSGQAGRA